MLARDITGTPGVHVVSAAQPRHFRTPSGFGECRTGVKKGGNSQQNVGYAVDEPGDAKIEPGKVAIDFWGEHCRQENGEKAYGPGDLEGEEDLDLGKILLLFLLADGNKRSARA